MGIEERVINYMITEESGENGKLIMQQRKGKTTVVMIAKQFWMG